MTAPAFPSLLFLAWAALAIIAGAWAWWRESPAPGWQTRVKPIRAAIYRHYRMRATLRAMTACFGGYIVTALLTLPFWF